MSELDLLSKYHTATKRDYVGRVTANDKAECAAVAKRFDKDYWDGDRKYGYGGYHYDGRWLPLAKDIARIYGLKAGDRVLDIGCGKAFLLFELTRVVPGIHVQGIDISKYAIDNAKEEVKPHLQVGNAIDLPLADGAFDLVYTINAFHNLYNYELMSALKEMQRVGKSKRYICVEAYRNERERVNLLYWQLTCEVFFTPEEWKWFYQLAGYDGDYGFIYFE